MSKLLLQEAVEKASRDWQEAFNDGDAVSCADFYEDDAIMQAVPFGIYCGKDTILTFWRQIKVINEQQAVLTANWSMNKASGVIHKEMWIRQDDCSVKLSEDHFEAL